MVEIKAYKKVPLDKERIKGLIDLLEIAVGDEEIADETRLYIKLLTELYRLPKGTLLELI